MYKYNKYDNEIMDNLKVKNKKKYNLLTSDFMKQKDFTQKSNVPFLVSAPKWITGLWLLLLLFAGSTSVLAQSVEWAGGTPRLDPETLISDGNPGTLELYFAAASDLPQGKVEIELPAGFQYVKYERGEKTSTGVDFKWSSSGQKLTLTITSNGGTLSGGKNIHAFVEIAAKCGALSSSNVNVTVSSGEGFVTNGNKTLPVTVETPVISITSTNDSQKYNDVEDEKEYELLIQSTNGLVKNVELALETEPAVTLSGFKLDLSDPVPAVTEKTVGNLKTYTIRMATLDQTVKTLKFKVKSSRPGSRTITPVAHYFLNTPCATQQQGQILTMVIPGATGKPSMKAMTYNYVDQDDKDVRWNALNVDNTVPNTIKAICRNEGDGEAWNVYVKVSVQFAAYIDLDEVYYQIGDGAKTKLDKDEYKKVTSKVASYPSMIANYPTSTKDLPRAASIYLPPEIKLQPNEQVTFWIDTYTGEIYDNGDNDAYLQSVYARINYTTIDLYAEDAQGELIRGTYVGINGGFTPNVSAFIGIPENLTLKSSQTVIQELPMHAGYLNSNNSSRVYVTLPDWMDLAYTANDLEKAVRLKDSNGTSYFPVAGSGKLENDVYSFIFSAIPSTVSQGSFLVFDLKATGSLDANEENRKGKITYWIDYIHNGVALKNVSRVHQNVTLIPETGIRLDSFSLQRTTKGLKDSNNKRMPDDGSVAPDNEINSYLYMSGDKGKMRWEATVLDGNYEYLYLPVQITGATVTIGEGDNFDINLLMDKLSLTIGGVSIPREKVSVINEGNSYAYLLLKDTNKEYLNSGKKVVLTLPFEDRHNSSNNFIVSAECFVSHKDIIKVSESFENQDRLGRDKEQKNVRFVNLGVRFFWMNSQVDAVFPSEGVEVAVTSYQSTFYTNLPSPYFGNEYRTHAYPYQLKWELPEGYEFVGEMTVGRGSGDEIGPDTKTLAPKPEGNEYVFDFESFYDLNYKGVGTPVADKWILPDDRFLHSPKILIKATKSAAPSSTAKLTLIYKNPITGNENAPLEQTITFRYLGATITVEPSLKTVKAYTTHVNIPNITVANNSTEPTLYNTWFYVEGSVKNLTLKGSGQTLKGEGFEGRWIPLGDIDGNTSLDYSLDFDFTGTSEDIKIYTLSGYSDDSWITPTDAKLSAQLLRNYLGGNTTIRVTMANPRLAGSIRISDPMIEHLEPYKLTLAIDGTLSEGLIRNPRAELVIPRGQVYLKNTATLSYDGKEISLDALFEAENDPQAPNQHTVVIDLKELLGKSEVLFPGFLSGDPDSKRKAIVTAQFLPQCNSVLTGMRYNATITGLNAADNEAPKYLANSPLMLPANTGKYIFSVTPQINQSAFNQWQASGAWQVTIRKITAPDIPVAAEDYLMLELPEAMEINGTINMNSADIAGLPASAASQDISEPESGKRTYKVILPTGKINASGNNGQGKDITFTIPVKLTGETAIPLHQLAATVVSTAKFGDCKESESGVGSGTTPIAILPAGSTEYEVSVGEKIDLQISANGLTGSWYADEALTNELEDSEGVTTYNYAPVASDFQGEDLSNGKEVTLWVSSLFPNEDDLGQTDDYGKVPVKVTVYPALTFDIAYPMAICGSGSFKLGDLIKATSVPEGVTVTLYSDEECTSAISFPYEVDESHSVWARAANKIFAGKAKEIEFTVLEPVSITGNLQEEIVYLDFGATTTLEVNAGGDGIAYTWYSDEVNGTDFTAIAGAESSTLKVSESGEYYVVVEGCNQVQSKTATIIICPKLVLEIDNTMPVAYCTTSESLRDGIRLKDYLKDANAEFTYLYKVGSGSYEEITNEIVLSKEAGETKYSIVARNKANTQTAAKELTIKIEEPLSITEQPASVTIRKGETATLKVVTEGENLTYQWQKKNTASEYENIATALNDTYSATEAGSYRVVVTGTTAGCGTEVLESDAATVTVRTPSQPEEESYLVTWEANWSGIVHLSLYGFNDIGVRSGECVDRGTRVVVRTQPGMAGVTLMKLTANGQEIMDGEVITISANTHIVATFELGDVDPDPDPVGNTTIENEVNVWSTPGQLHIETATPTEAVIYSVTGQLIAKRGIAASESFHLPAATYVVRVGDRIIKTLVK